MAMNYAWQERKKFAIPVATGVAVLLVWYVFILSSINNKADNDVRNKKTAELQLRGLMQAGVPTDEGVGRSDRDKGAFQKDLKDIREKLAFRIDEGYRAKEGTSSQGKLGSKRQEVFKQIDELRTRKGLDTIDSKLGFPQTFAGVPEEVLTEWLMRLAIVQRVCVLSLECGVQGLKLIEVADPAQADPTVPAEKFMGVLVVKFKVTGTSETILRLMHGLQVEGPQYLSLEACSILAPNPGLNQLTCEFSVGALVVKPEGKLVVEVKQ